MSQQQDTDYQSSPFLNYSGMKKLLISPAHYKMWLAEQTKKEEPERELRIGLATHSLCLEPHLFDQKYAIAPVCDRRTTEGKRIWKEHLESSPGKMSLTAEEFTIAQACSDSVKRNSWFKKAMEDPKLIVEKPFFLKNEHFRHGIKGRPDMVSPGNNIILDIKTHGGQLNRDDIQNSIRRNHYYLQELVYSILTNSNDIPVNDFVFIFVEKNEPFSSVSVCIDNRFMAKDAMDEMTAAVSLFNECMDRNEWPDLSSTSIVI